MELRSVVNFRDIGGHATADGRRVRHGRVYRCGHLADITDAELEILGRAGVRTVVDLRTASDIGEDGGTRLPAGALRLHLPMGDPAGPGDVRGLFARRDPVELEKRLGGGRAEAMMAAAARALVTEHASEWGVMLRALAADAAFPAIVHCSAGKDRTGFAATLLLLVAGVPDAAIVDHYLASNEHRVDENARLLAGLAKHIDPEWILPFLEVRAHYVEASLEVLRERFGDIEGYARALGLDAAELRALQQNLVE